MTDLLGLPPPAMPPRVAAAITYLRFAESLRNPPPSFSGMVVEGRNLGSDEQTVYDGALAVLRRYFNDPSSDIAPPALPQFGGDDGIKDKEPVRT